jgi:hypothetical protein
MYKDKAVYVTVRFPGAEADALKDFADRTRGGNVTGCVREAVRTFITADKNVKAEKKILEKT